MYGILGIVHIISYFFFRYLDDEETLVLVANFGQSSYDVDLVSNFDVILPDSMNVKVVSSGSTTYKGAPLNTKTIKLNGVEAVILGTA